MPAKSLRVLILENQSFQRAIAIKILTQLGCTQIFEAETGNQAITLLERAGPVDVVVCDVRMDGMDGLEFIHRAGAAGLVKGLVISSGLISGLRCAVTQLAARVGMTFLGDVGKPLSLEAMADALARIPVATQPAPVSAVSPPGLTEEDVRRGLSHKEFKAHYLPRCDLGSGNIKGVDVVARWDHPAHGLLDEALFMPLVESSGQLDELLVVLLQQGLELQRHLLADGRLLRMSLPLRLTQLRERGLTRRIRSLMQFHRSAGQGIAFELTLNSRQEPSAAHLENLIRLRMLGCGLGLGAFGGSGGSLRRLCQFPFSEVRMAAVFMDEMEQHPRQRAVIKSTLALATNLGLGVTVVGVKRAGQHLLLMDMGCMIGQGSYFSPVLDRQELLGQLDHRVRAD